MQKILALETLCESEHGEVVCALRWICWHVRPWVVSGEKRAHVRAVIVPGAGLPPPSTTPNPLHTHILFSFFFIRQKKKEFRLILFFPISYVFICVRYFITCQVIALLILLCACIICNKCCYIYVYTSLLSS